jgi:hypothetical protein
MYRVFLGLLFVSILVSGCTPTETPELSVEYNFSYVYVSQGMTHEATIADQDVSIRLASDGGIDTSGVVVTIHDLRTSYMIETADPRSRYLPSIQFEPRLDIPVQEISIVQYFSEQDPFIQVLEGDIPEGTEGEFLGVTSLGNLPSFLSRKILGNSVNLLFDVPPRFLEFGEVEVYRTPGTLSFMLDVPDTVLINRHPDLPAYSTQEKNTVVISLQTHTFETIETSILVYRAQFLLDEFLVAQSEDQLGIPVTGSEDDVIPTPIGIPEIDTDAFPAVDPRILGDCPESVHNQFSVIGPDGNSYRSWHPIIVEIDPSIRGGQLCSFAHEHGDPPHPKAPLPYFGYPAYQAGELDVIRQHEGYKVFTHVQGQRTGWDTQERKLINPDIDMQFWAHQGSWRESRPTDRFHDVGFWSQDSQGNLTEVYYLADTGEVSRNCPGQYRGARSRNIASVCDYSIEIWDFGGEVGTAWSSPVELVVTNPMNFMLGDPGNLQSIQFISTSEEICANSSSICDYILPFGHAESIWLGNERQLREANWQWSNLGGAEFFCTDFRGNRAEDLHCNDGEHGYLQQRVAAINYFGGISDIWDRTFEGIGDLLHLPYGAPGGN